MASWVGKPDPSKWPVGTTVHVYPLPKSPWSQTGKPPGSQVTEAAVASDGSLTFTGLTEGVKYLGWATVSAVDQYLSFGIDTAAPSGSGAVTSVNGKEGAVVLAASDVEAAPLASPSLTGTPKAPTAAAKTSTTQIATTAFVQTAASEAAGAVTSVFTRTGAVVAESNDYKVAQVEGAAPLASPALTGTPKAPTAAEGTNTTQVATTAFTTAAVAAEAALRLAKANNLSDLASASAARTNLGLGTAATQASTAFDASGAAATAQSNAEAASMVRGGVHASVVTNGTTATTDQVNPVNAEAEARTIKLATGLGAGHRVAVEKSDTSANEVTIEASLRGIAAQTITLKLAKQILVLETDSSGSWWPIASHIPLTTLKEAVRVITRRTVSIPAGQVPGNEVVLDEYIKLASGEKRKIVWFECHTASGTIKVTVKRGEAGTTEIAALKELEATTAIKLTAVTQELSDKDRLTITLSAGATPKGVTITWGEEVIAP